MYRLGRSSFAPAGEGAHANTAAAMPKPTQRIVLATDTDMSALFLI
jgi:hypothetical protein